MQCTYKVRRLPRCVQDVGGHTQSVTKTHSFTRMMKEGAQAAHTRTRSPAGTASDGRPSKGRAGGHTFSQLFFSFVFTDHREVSPSTHHTPMQHRVFVCNKLALGPNHFLQGGLLCDSLMPRNLLKCRREAFRVTCSLSWLYLGRHPSVVMPQSTPFKFHRSSSSSRIAPPHHVSRVALSSWVVTRIVSRAVPSALPSWSIARLIGSVNVF